MDFHLPLAVSGLTVIFKLCIFDVVLILNSKFTLDSGSNKSFTSCLSFYVAYGIGIINILW